MLLRSSLLIVSTCMLSAADGVVMVDGNHTFAGNRTPQGLRGVTAIGAGAYSTAAVSGGRVVHWAIYAPSVPADLAHVVAVSVASTRVIALLDDASVRTWSSSGYDAMPAAITAVAQIEVSNFGNSCVARLADGSVMTWTPNDPASAATVPMPAGGARWIATDTGSTRSMAVAVDGTVVQWGASVPAVPGGTTGIARVALGRAHTVALHDDGSVTCWGDNGHGQSTVPGGLVGVIAIAATADGSAALLPGGTVVCWGTIDPPPPAATQVTDLRAGLDHLAALRSDGTVVTWGLDCTRGAVEPPLGLATPASLAISERHVVARTIGGTVLCWGWNGDGQCDPPAGLNGVTAVAAGDGFSLALKSDGTVVGWGAVATLPVYTSVTAISACGAHALILHADGSVANWGTNYYGEAVTPFWMPAVVSQVSAGRLHSAAITPSGTLVTWGAIASSGQNAPATSCSCADYGLIALLNTGQVQTWGYPPDMTFALPVGQTFVEVASSAYGHFARTAGGYVYETNAYFSCQGVSAMFTGDGAMALIMADHAPTDITIDSVDVLENSPIGTVIGHLIVADEDTGDTFTYFIGTANSFTPRADVSFQSASQALLVNAALDHEQQPLIPLTIAVFDAAGISYRRNIVINVLDVNEAPTDIALTGGIVAGAAAGTVAGTLAATDEDVGDSHAFTLVAGAGASDNASFGISGTQLVSTAPLSAGTAYSIRVRATDSGALAVEKVFAVTPTPAGTGGGAGSTGTVATGTTGASSGSAGAASGGGGCGLGGLGVAIWVIGMGWRRRWGSGSA